MKVPEEIASKLPENWEKDWAPIAPEDIEVGDYIGYVAKARKYQSGTDSAGGFRKGGFITFLPDEDQSAIKGNDHKVFGFRQYAVKWTVNQDNVLMFFKTKKDTQEILNKGKVKSKETKESRRINKVEVENKNLQEELQEAKEITKNAPRPIRKSKKRKETEGPEVVSNPESEPQVRKPYERRKASFSDRVADERRSRKKKNLI